MKKWQNDLIVQILLTALFAAVFLFGCVIEMVVAGDALSAGSMTEPANKDDFEIMLVIYVMMIAVTAGCGIWGKNLVADILAGAYGLLFICEPPNKWLIYRPFFASWESRLEILCQAAHVIIFAAALIDFIMSVRRLYKQIRLRA